jgi:hypothetical protein
LPWNGNHLDTPAVRAGDPSHRWQPQSRATLVRTEERTEDSRFVFIGDATAIVFNLDNDFPAGSLITVRFTQSHDHRSVSVNGLYGVGKKPMHRILNLTRINIHYDRL